MELRSYELLMYVHLITVVPCVFLGLYLLLVKKGDPTHRLLGKIYMCLMLFTATVTLFMPAHVGTQVLDHFGWIHLFSFLTVYTVPKAYYDIRKGDIKGHQRAMISLYIGALIIAGGFTFAPGRYLHTLFFN